MAIAHAEIIAIYRAMKKLKKEWLYGAILFSTLEPCFMCFYASILARVDKIIFFVKRDKVNITDFFSALWDEKKINHFPKIIFLYDKRFKILLQAFFRFLRKGDKIKLGKNSSDYFFV
jgi:tRNA(adenine34) deaminase